MARKYELKQRALSQAETRQRIVEATVDLHRAFGPVRTTISAIAERAGVQRLTVYRHFPDERSLFRACSRHWVEVNPRPDPSAWAAVEDPEERLRMALGEIYAFFRRTEDMTAHILRDLQESAVLREVAAPLVQYWADVREVLRRGWGGSGGRRKVVRAVVGHAVEFETWRSLVRRNGLSDAEAVEAMLSLARAAPG